MMAIKNGCMLVNPFKTDSKNRKSNRAYHINFVVTKAGSVRVVRTKQSSNRDGYEKIRKEALRLRKV
ncbi:MAG: hypothetical protein MJ245_07160 [Clostridia bacterium]|nr:hypothetical protein [Clostridia bacterium]